MQARFGLLGLKDDSFPRIKLFKKGQDTAKPVEYTGTMKDSSELLRWTVEQTGVFVGVKVGMNMHARHLKQRARRQLQHAAGHMSLGAVLHSQENASNPHTMGAARLSDRVRDDFAVHHVFNLMEPLLGLALSTHPSLPSSLACASYAAGPSEGA